MKHRNVPLREAMRELADDAVIVDVNNDNAMYQNTANARFLWQALIRLRDAGAPVPPDLLDVFVWWGRRMLAAETPSEILDALQLRDSKARHSGRALADAYRRRFEVAMEVDLICDVRRMKPAEAIRALARRTGRREAAVKKDYYTTKRGGSLSTRRPLRSVDTDPLLSAISSSWR